MVKTPDYARYSAFKSKDSRFDGRFFVGISSTGIYCRPICRARLPKIGNCTFYPTAATAEQAGYRPCLLCRPELAPGNAPVDATPSLVQRATRMLEERCGYGESLKDITGRLGYTDRHLRRAFVAEYRVTPVQYLQTCRLLLAKNLLTNSDLSITEVAIASGFGSLRRFNDLFKKRYRMAPTALRKRNVRGGPAGNVPALSLGYRPPYTWEPMLDFLAGRAIPGVEKVEKGEYQRVAYFTNGPETYVYGWVRVKNRPDKNALDVTVDASLLSVLPKVVARVRHLFDLSCDPMAVHEVLAAMNEINPALCVAGTRLPGCFDAFEMAVRAVLGQQITVKAAKTLAARMAGRFGVPVNTGIDGLTHAFPSPEAIMAMGDSIGDHLGPLGITGARAKTILALAQAIKNGGVEFGANARPETEMEKLAVLPGIGPWTANYIAMRAMGWPDAFPHTDYGIKKALEPRNEKEILSLAEAWRPWRSYATINLWNSL